MPGFDPIQMMMWQMAQGGMGGGQQAQPAQNAAPQMPQQMGDYLRRLNVANQGAPESHRGGIIPMMAGGQMGTVGDDLTRSAAGAMPMTPQEAPGWMDQFGKFLDGMDPNVRLMMGLGGMQNLGRVLGGGA